MSIEKKYSIRDIEPVKNPVEHIRKRPGMYIGRVDERGNLQIIQYLFEFITNHTHWTKAIFRYLENDSFQIEINNSLNLELLTENTNSTNFELFILPALSEKYNVRSNGKELLFENGQLIAESEVPKSDELLIAFTFDTTILRSKKLSKYLLLNFFKRYSFLYPEKEIIVYENEKIAANFVSKGMKDWFETHSFDAALLMEPFKLSVEDTSLDLKAEIQFSITDGKEKFSTITLPRADFVILNGTHTEGFLKGLQSAIRKIIGEDFRGAIFHEFRNPIGVFKLSYPEIVFHGPTRNKVGSKELTTIFEKQVKQQLLSNSLFKEAIVKLYGL
ncbi:MAG: hypothetical protein AAF617_02680 [Bacteroidota bacterium]